MGHYENGRWVSEDPMQRDADANGGYLPMPAQSEWSKRERAVIAELMASQQLSEHAVLRQGLRWYQLAVRRSKEGFPNVRWQANDGTLKPRDDLKMVKSAIGDGDDN